MEKLRIVYLGTPEFAILPLKKLVECKDYSVVAVVTNNDKPVGRKQILTPPPVKKFAIEQGIPVYQYAKIRAEGVEDLRALQPDLMITCAFGQILSQEILDIPKYGVVNIHASLLPKYRGASPIHYAILNGEKTTGITIMKTDIGIDTGDMILQKEMEILPQETCGELFVRLSELGADCLMQCLPTIFDSSAKYIKQNHELATFSKVIKKEYALVDWSKDAQEIYNQVRAFNPAPVAFTYMDGNPFKIYSAKVVEMQGKPGQILKSDNELIIACGNNAISLLMVQKAGGKPMCIKDFLRGNKFAVGSEFK